VEPAEIVIAGMFLAVISTAGLLIFFIAGHSIVAVLELLVINVRKLLRCLWRQL
jgi:hypothetical protein